jgi:hypothetical protein
MSKWTFDTERFPGLLHRVTVEAEDLAGNAGTSTLEPVVTTSYAIEAEDGEQTTVTGRIKQQEPNGNLVVFLNATTFGKPESTEGAMAPLTAEQPPKRRRAYRFTECAWDAGGLGLGSEIPVRDLAELRDEVALLAKEQAEAQGSSQQCYGELETGLGQKVTVRWAVSASGLFFYRQGTVVWVEEKPDCKQWGPKAPADWTHCKTAGNLSTEHLDIIGDWRWPPDDFSPGFVPLSAVCARLNGVLPVNPPKQENGELVIHESMHFHYWPVDRHGEEQPPCDWEHPGQVAGY